MADENTIKAAQLVRRATLTNDRRLVEKFSKMSYADAVDELLNLPLDTPTVPASATNERPGWWVNQVFDTSNVLHERVNWFWHTLLTSHFRMCKPEMVAKQIDNMRKSAFGASLAGPSPDGVPLAEQLGDYPEGSYPTLLKAYLRSPVLIIFLDAAGNSKGSNENLGRELLELFTLGVGNYTLADIQAVSKAIAGWYCNYNSPPVEFRPNNVYNDAVTILGENKKWNIYSVVDKICSMEATQTRIAGIVWYHFAGTKLPDEKAKALGAKWAENKLDIKWLLREIFIQSENNTSENTRFRTGFEFYCAASSILSPKEGGTSELERMRTLGQVPYEVPDVSGWGDDQWSSSASALRKAKFLDGFDYGPKASDSIDEILLTCGIYNVSKNTLEALESVQGSGAQLAKLRYMVAMSSPEFSTI